MRFLRRSLVGLTLVSLTLALLVWAGALVVGAVQTRMSAEPRVPQARERVFAVNVLTAEEETLTPILTAFGEVRSRRTLQVRAAAGGRILDLAEGFEDGGRVEAGDLLVRIDATLPEAALSRARADLSDAEAEVRDAERGLTLARDTLAASEEQADLRQRALARQADLLDRGVGTAALVEEAELAAASARQSVVSARTGLAQAEARVDQAATALARATIARDEAQRAVEDTEVRAEFAGTLSDVTVVEGGLVSANEQMAQLIDPDALEVSFRVSTAQYARLLDEAGRLRAAPVTAALGTGGIEITATGTISRASAAVGEGQVGRMVFARLDAPGGLRPGDFVTVTTEEPPLEQVVRLPSGALNAANAVLVLDEDERLESLPVTLERRQGDDVIVRGAGLAGREVVRERTPLLGPGIKVRPIRPVGAEEAREVAEAGTSEAGTSETGSPETAAASARPAGADAGEMVELTDERRARIRAFIESSARMPDEMKTRILAQLDQPQVPASMVARIEARMGS